MKKIVSLLLASLLALSLTACGGAKTPAEETQPTEETQSAEEKQSAEETQLAEGSQPMEEVQIVEGSQSAEEPAAEVPATDIIAPLPVEFDAENPGTCQRPADIDVASLKKDGSVQMTLYKVDLYDAAQISQIAKGKTIVYDGKPVGVTGVEKKNGVILINGGMDNGGFELVGHDGGTFIVCGWDDYPTYTALGTVRAVIGKNVVMTDASNLDSEPVVTVGANIPAALTAENTAFNHYNTTVTFEKGVLTAIDVVYTP